jgi:hypothetical protein
MHYRECVQGGEDFVMLGQLTRELGDNVVVVTMLLIIKRRSAVGQTMTVTTRAGDEAPVATRFKVCMWCCVRVFHRVRIIIGCRR